jgi:hypothetical protein
MPVKVKIHEVKSAMEISQVKEEKYCDIGLVLKAVEGLKELVIEEENKFIDDVRRAGSIGGGSL